MLSIMYHTALSKAVSSVFLPSEIILGTHETRIALFYSCTEPSKEGWVYLEICHCTSPGNVKWHSLLATPSMCHR